MGGIVNDLAVLAQGGVHVGVQAQDPVVLTQAGPHNVVILVGVGQAIGRLKAEETVIIPEAAVEHRRVGPVAVEAQVRQAQVHTVLGFIGQVYEAFHIDAVFKVLVHPYLVLLRQ